MVGLLVAFVSLASGADGGVNDLYVVFRWLTQEVGLIIQWNMGWYVRTPPAERICWGGLTICGILSTCIIVEGIARLRRSRVIPRAFQDRFRGWVVNGAIDRSNCLDYCELNPSPAARIALEVVRHWGWFPSDLERTVRLAGQSELNHLRRKADTLRRIVFLAPMLGLLASLFEVNRCLISFQMTDSSRSWGSTLGASLGPLTTGLALAILALVAYDGLVGHVEAVSDDLDRLGVEIIDAMRMERPSESRRNSYRTESANLPRAHHPRHDEHSAAINRSMDRGFEQGGG